MFITRLTSVLKSSVTLNSSRTVSVSSPSSSEKISTQPLKSWRQIPGPSSLPIIGQLLHYLPGGHLSNANNLQSTLFDLYGPIARLDAIFGRPVHIFLSDPDSAAFLLRSENKMPTRPGFQSLAYYRKHHNKTKDQSLRPTGLLTDHGSNWRQIRTTVNPVMMQPKTIRLYTTVLDEVSMDMVTKLKSIRDKDNKIQNFDLEMNLWALESIAVVALGGRLNCFDPNLPADSPARRLIQCVHGLFELVQTLDFKPNFWRYFSTKAFKEAMKLYEDHENLARYFIRKAMKELKTKDKSDDEKGVLEKLMEIDEEIAVIMAAEMLFAGVDTAANTLIGMLYLLSINPEKQNKLREEILSKEVSKRYMKACIKEALRIYPVVPGNMRQTSKEYDILGYRIPKDMYIVLNHQLMSSMAIHFPRPKEFIPERWIEKDSPIYYRSAHPFAYSPFGFGSRMCIGRRIAELEMEAVVAKMLENFEIEWNGSPPKVSAEALNYIKGPYNFVFKDI